MTDAAAVAPEVERLWGCGDIDALFRGRPKAVLPWPRAGRKKIDRPGDRVPASLLGGRPWLVEVDPRFLVASQTWLVRQHAAYYCSGIWERTGTTSADMESAPNRYPIVVEGADGQRVIVTGHHRSFVALVEGRPVLARLSGTAPDESLVVTPALRDVDPDEWPAVAVALVAEGLDTDQIEDRRSMAMLGATRAAR